MILTGKAKEDFLKWYYYNNYHHQVFTETSDDIFINALIIEWFDSVGIIINVGGVLQNENYSFSFDIQENNTLNGIDEYGFSNRQEATKQAIIKANDIYNEKEA